MSCPLAVWCAPGKVTWPSEDTGRIRLLFSCAIWTPRMVLYAALFGGVEAVLTWVASNYCSAAMLICNVITPIYHKFTFVSWCISLPRDFFPRFGQWQLPWHIDLRPSSKPFVTENRMSNWKANPFPCRFIPNVLTVGWEGDFTQKSQ